MRARKRSATAIGAVAFGAVAVGAVALAASCGGGQTRGSPFDPHWKDDHGASMARIEEALRRRHVPLGADVAVGVVGENLLVGVPLDKGDRWSFLHAMEGRPSIAGALVVGAGGGEIFAIEARTGKLVWSRATGGHLRGAGDDGITTVVSLAPARGYGSLVLAIARDGSVVRQLEEEEEAIGVPAVLEHTVLMPWKGRYLSAYDMPSGDERARLLMPEPVSRVMAIGGVLFAGEATFTRIDDRLASAAPSTVSLPRAEVDVLRDVPWTRAGTEWVPRQLGEADVAHVFARPTITGAAGVAGGRYAATYARVAMGFDAGTGKLVWVHAHDAAFRGGAAAARGFALCDARGSVLFVDGQTGGVSGRRSLGDAVDACIVQVDDLVIPSAPRTTTLAEEIAAVLAIPDADVAPLQKALRSRAP